MRLEPDNVFEIDGRGPLDAVVAVMGDVQASSHGWLNLSPGVPDELVPAVRPTSAFSIFGNRGPDVPICTWTPARNDRRPEPASLGVRHAAGTNAADRLTSAGVALPSGWSVVQDHPKRGLVVVQRDPAPDAETLAWLLRAGEELSRLPTTGWWLVQVYLR